MEGTGVDAKPIDDEIAKGDGEALIHTWSLFQVQLRECSWGEIKTYEHVEDDDIVDVTEI